MKAILVIDIDDSLVEGEERFAVDGYLMQESDCVGCYEAVGRINAVLKPMPKKKEAYAESYTERADEFSAKTHPLYADGWNACLEEITGETE